MSTSVDPANPKRLSDTSTSVPYVPQPESLVIPDGPVGEEATELLNEFVHPHHHGSADTLAGSKTSDDDTEDDGIASSKLPWWKRPSPWW